MIAFQTLESGLDEPGELVRRRRVRFQMRREENDGES